jgi:hypothetical protein
MMCGPLQPCCCAVRGTFTCTDTAQCARAGGECTPVALCARVVR